MQRKKEKGMRARGMSERKRVVQRPKTIKLRMTTLRVVFSFSVHATVEMDRHVSVDHQVIVPLPGERSLLFFLPHYKHLKMMHQTSRYAFRPCNYCHSLSSVE